MKKSLQDMTFEELVKLTDTQSTIIKSLANGTLKLSDEDLKLLMKECVERMNEWLRRIDLELDKKEDK